MLPWAPGRFFTNLCLGNDGMLIMFALLCILFSDCSCLCSSFHFQTWAWCCLYRILYEDFVIFLILSSLLHLSLTLRRPILHRGPRVGPVTWPWRAGTAPAMPPRSQREEAPRISGHEVLFYLIIFIWQQRFKICCA